MKKKRRILQLEVEVHELRQRLRAMGEAFDTRIGLVEHQLAERQLGSPAPQPPSVNMTGNVDPTDPTDCRHVFGAWNRSHKLQNRWRQCQACGAVETISAQAGREALDPNATAYLNPAAAAEQRRRTQVPTEQADPPF